MACALHKGTRSLTKPMKDKTMKNETFESTYAMLVRSEEKERSLSETAVYLLLILSTVFSIWQAAHQPVTVPTSLIPHAPMAQTVAVQDQKA